MSNADLYKKLEEISGGLRGCGLDAWAAKLDDAKVSGSTSGEILMAARWNLLQLKASDASIPDGILQNIDSAVNYINSLGI